MIYGSGIDSDGVYGLTYNDDPGHRDPDFLTENKKYDCPERHIDFDVLQYIKNPSRCRYNFSKKDSSFLRRLVEQHIRISVPNFDTFTYRRCTANATLIYEDFKKKYNEPRDNQYVCGIDNASPYFKIYDDTYDKNRSMISNGNLYFSKFRDYDIILYLFVRLGTGIIAPNTISFDEKKIDTQKDFINNTSFRFDKVSTKPSYIIRRLFDHYHDQNIEYVDYNLVDIIKDYLQ